MLTKLSRTGSGNYTAEVKAFQQLWNEAADAVTAGGVAFRSLVTDGKYGANTAYAVQQFLKPVVPTKAYQIPTWYVQNKSAVDQMGTYASPQPNTSTDFTPVNNQAVTSSVVDVAQHPTVVTERIQTSPVAAGCDTVGSADMAECQRLGWDAFSKRFSIEPEPAPAKVVVQLQPAVIEDIMPAPAPMVGPSTPTKLPETKITAPKPSTDYRVVAVGAGVVLLGGLLTWNVVRKKRKAA